ncbi:MAG: tRNA pseudouridine(38-40) synthase TruA, partial [Beijerinckiaceae bacterium]|nr:tRNA pseudouridine(38-40) synthase TruA [Beijerinckiaceae bacterium]
MARFRLDIEYAGTRFVGWQRQANGLAVQQVIEDALAAVDGAPVVIRGAGRTDTGVHATAQVAHVDL